MAAKKKAAAKKVVGGREYVPPGSYDPTLDANLYKSRRDLQNLVGLNPTGNTYGGDIGTALERAASDYATARTQAKEDYDTGTGRTEQGYQRNLSDLLLARQRGTEDYGTNIGTLQRNYQNLATSQGEQQRKAGAFPGGGAVAQATRKRAGNLAIDRSPIDTAYQRATTDSQTQESRYGQDRQASLDDLLRQYQRGTGQLDIGYGRTTENYGTQATRGQIEQSAYESDVEAAKRAQFQQLHPGAKLPVVGGRVVAPSVQATNAADLKRKRQLEAQQRRVAQGGR
jgi:hypothetical protein